MSDVRSSVLGGSYDRPTDASARIQFRRALTLLTMTLFMPGSAQLVAGDKRIGRIAIRVWLTFLGFGALVLLLSVISREGLFNLIFDTRILTIGRWVLIAGAISWVALIIDAWRLGRPLEMRRKHRLWMTGLNGVLCFVTAGTLFFAAHLVAVQTSFIGTFASGTTSEAKDGRYNILLLGGDSGPDRSGLRPDSLTVASIDRETGRTVLVGLPRNLENVPFPKGSVMHKEFPNGFDCETSCYLNGVNTWANDHADKFDEKDPGIDATMGAVEAITGLKMNYYAMVNMHGLSKLVNAVGGVTVDVKQRTAIGGIGSPIRGYIEAGTQKLTGDQVLWYSRSRVQNNDFSRMGRQKCVLNAMVHQLSPKSVLLNVEKIAESSKALLTTSIPQQDLGTFANLALKAKTQKISTVSLVPPVIYTGNPDYDKVRRLIADAIAKAEGQVATESTMASTKLSIPKTSAESEAAKKDPTQANQTSDLAATC